MGKSLTKVLSTLSRSYPGPGGAVAALRRGEVLESHTWGWANAEHRIPFTPQTPFRVCSITKQFTCALLLKLVPTLDDIDKNIQARMGRLQGELPSVRQLCNNQSGFRDYWALAMLHGSAVEAPFGNVQARQVIRMNRALQFSPGTRYSYSNQNFRMLSDILEERAGRDFAELLRQNMLDEIGMYSTFIGADTSEPVGDTVGYEGSSETGFRAAINRIHWTGDAGLVSTLDDMVAWERYIDCTREDDESIYKRLSAPVAFLDGTKASYGFGLAHRVIGGRGVTGHTGALRGWRCHRLYVPADRVSVVVLFNHDADASGAALELLSAIIGEADIPLASALPATVPWCGNYLEPETEIATRVELNSDGKIGLGYGHINERLEPTLDGATSSSVSLHVKTDGLWMERLYENQLSRLICVEGDSRSDFMGSYYCNELDSHLHVADCGDALYGAFSGFLGQGQMELLCPFGRDVWLLPCRRSLDAPAPGDWTLRIVRDNQNRVSSITVGCVLARKLHYSRVR